MKEPTVVVDCPRGPSSRSGLQQNHGHSGKHFWCVSWPVLLPQHLLFWSYILSTSASPSTVQTSPFTQMESQIVSPASLVLPHLLPYQPCLDLLPLCPTKAPPPRCLHPPWRPLKQHWSMKLSLKTKNDIFEPLAFLQQDQHPPPGGGMSRGPLFPAKR